MPQTRVNVRAIFREWMVMTYIMILHMCSIITKKILDIGVVSISVMHSTVVYDNYLRNLVRTPVITSITDSIVAIYEIAKNELRKIVNTYLNVVHIMILVTYCSIFEPDCLIEIFNRGVISNSLQENRIPSVYEYLLKGSTQYNYCNLLFNMIISPFIPNKQSKITIIEPRNIYINIVYSALIVTYCSMIESGRLYRTFTQGVLILLLVVHCSMIEAGRLYRTFTQDLFILPLVTHCSIIESGQLLRTTAQVPESTYLYVVYCLTIVTYCSMIESGRSLRTITRKLFVLLVVIQCSIIEAGRLFRTTVQKLKNTYLYVVYCVLIVAYCSMIESGRSSKTINQKLLVSSEAGIIYTSVTNCLSFINICFMSESGRSVQIELVEAYLQVAYCLIIVTYGSIIKISQLLRKITESESKNYKTQTLNIYSVISSVLIKKFIRFYYIDQLTNVLLYFVNKRCKFSKITTLKIIYFNLYKKIINYRAWSCRDLQSAASEATYKARERRVEPNDTILVPHVDGIHGTASPNSASKFPVDKQTVANRIAGYRHNKKWHTDSGHPDTRHMTAFLKYTPDPAVLYDPGLVDFEKLITSKAPILDYLKLYTDMQGTWDYPPREEIAQWRLNRGISPQWFQGTTITEYVIGSDDNFDDFKALFWQNFHADQELLPTGVVSLDVEDKKIWKFDLLRICNFRDQVIPLKKSKENIDDLPVHLHLDSDGKTQENKEVNVPAKIMFGGVHWGMMISLGITSTSKDEYTYDCKGFPEEVIDFLESLPPIVGAGIKADVKGVESFVYQVTGRDMRFKAFLELGVLATLCGWQLQRRGMFILSLITLGSTMNKLVSCADGQWGIPFHELDPAMQCYAIGDTKMGHITYGVLISAFLHQVAPDPDMACRLSQCTQFEWVSWFCTMIRESLVGLEISQQAAESHSALHGSYQELVDIIRYRDIHGKVSAAPPASVTFIAGLVKWPSLSAGGPRYLHPVRLHHLSVHNAIRESSGIPGTKQYFSRKVDASDRMYATFGHKDVLSLDLSRRIQDPELSDFQFSLEVHPGLAKPILSIDFPLEITYIHSRSTRLDRGVREALLEWFRLDISRVDQFHQNCNDSRDLAVAMRGRYEDIRLMYFGLMNREPVAVFDTEESITEEVKTAIAKQRAFKQELLAAVQQQDDILHELYLADSGIIYQDRYAWKKKPLPRVVIDTSRPVLDSTGAVLESGSAPRPGYSSNDGNRVGRHLVDRLEELDVVEPSLGLFPVTSMKMPDQCLDGGRSTGNRKGKGKTSWPSGDTNRRVMTQDEVEEEVRVVRHVGDEFDYCVAEMEEFLNDLPPTPEIAIVLED